MVRLGVFWGCFGTEMSVAGESLKPWIRTDLSEAAALAMVSVPGRALVRFLRILHPDQPVPNALADRALCPAGRSSKPTPVPLTPVLSILKVSRVETVLQVPWFSRAWSP